MPDLADDSAKAAGEAIKEPAPQDDYFVELEQFFQSVRTGKTPESNAGTALKACVACLKANEAIATGRKIHFREEWFEI